LTDITICVIGTVILAGWLLRTSLGRNALSDSAPRRNNMPVYLAFIPLFICFGTVPIALSITRELLPDLSDWQNAFLDNLVLCIGATVAVAVIIFLVRAHFARRLKGFGLNVKTIHKDFAAAVVNLLSVWPLLMLAIILTSYFGKRFWGQEFEVQQHHELELLRAYPQMPVTMVIIITVVIVAPLFEEMLFRGLFQTIIRSFAAGPWLSIMIGSALFAMVHNEPAHWPALFVLAACLGYAYERSGSLLRPIFIHSLFNATTIINVLISKPGG